MSTPSEKKIAAMFQNVESYSRTITVTCSSHTTKFHDFSPNLLMFFFTICMTFPGLENVIVKFDDFSRFSMTVGTLKLA